MLSSSAVRRILSECLLLQRCFQQEGGIGWMLVAAETALTVADLTVLQSLGYVIQRGYLGINPLLAGLF